MALALTNVPYTLEDVPYLKPDRSAMLPPESLARVPTLVTPDGEVMTESAAMILHLHDVAPQTGRLPDQPERARFLNLLIRLVAAIYPYLHLWRQSAAMDHKARPPTCCERVHTRRADLLRERVHTRRAERDRPAAVPPSSRWQLALANVPYTLEDASPEAGRDRCCALNP